MGCDRRCCCKAKAGNCNFQLGVPGNEIALICESPTVASMELDIPLVGRTGVNLCRIFKRLIDKYDWDEKKTCLRAVTICNASPKKQEYAGLAAQDYIVRMIAKNVVHICIGAAAIDLYQDIAERFRNKVVIELPHLGDRGLAKLSLLRSATNEQKLDAIARWIAECRKRGGNYSIGEFERFYVENQFG